MDNIKQRIAESIDEFLITFWDGKSFDNRFLNKMVDYIIYKNPNIFKEVNDEEPIENKIMDIYGVDIYEYNKEFIEHFCHKDTVILKDTIGTDYIG